MNKYKIILILITLFSFQSLLALRLISTSPAITQTLDSLSLSNKVVGVSSYCKIDKKVSRVGTSFSLNWERVLKLKPDYLLMQKVDDSNNLKKAKKLGVKVKEYEFLNVKTLRTSILKLGKDFSVDTKKIISKFDDQVTMLKKINFNKKVLAVISLNEKMGEVVSVTAVGSNNYYDDLLNFSKTQNVVKRKGYPTLSVEKVLKLDVDYIFIFSPHLDKETEAKFKKITNKKVITWRDYESQEVGSLFIKFMRSYYEKLSSQV